MEYMTYLVLNLIVNFRHGINLQFCNEPLFRGRRLFHVKNYLLHREAREKGWISVILDSLSSLVEIRLGNMKLPVNVLVILLDCDCDCRNVIFLISFILTNI